mmetsp:Transcript_7103/g.12347  ORF Transcript_7103/g.12347 Transcript_7103/m.12347 type:complete len:83 (+) Transcript_7103:359-607(+)
MNSISLSSQRPLCDTPPLGYNNLFVVFLLLFVWYFLDAKDRNSTSKPKQYNSDHHKPMRDVWDAQLSPKIRTGAHSIIPRTI